ncbi:hypothetical protein CW745_11775 [Psychromonas sp. psych-6C06]|uniref:hypothetical protein n=1 Tax=Psychromonas sp. psych-6C06 TaxID=2058089 RepID=UPI000C33F91A|nr:hypothetical protein [Psychromonas sp. psych-6C06]PKF60986.1 hypothetical protein CW745_11775 [Psychromonas sp. psych-6C06]
MQWIAILTALGWTLLQVFLLFVSTQCIFGLIEFRTATENMYQKALSHTIMFLFYSLFILPLISLGLFCFAVVNITGWHELEPAIWIFVTWCGVLFTFFTLLSVKK